MNKIKISIFTPTYNRASLLTRLYDSLQTQTDYSFEWIIVDDGSTDDTKALIDSFSNAHFPINYYYQENAGKHFAINRGVKEAKGELFFILDSDDILPPNAIALVLEKYFALDDTTRKNIGGVSGRKAQLNGEIIGNDLAEEMIMTVFDFRYEKMITGDQCEVYKTAVLNEFPFPEIKGEKFCPEALVWNRIGTKYPLLWFNDIVYLAEYQAEGLTAKIFEVRKKSPVASTICYQELSQAPIPFKFRFRALINYWRFAFYLKVPFVLKIKAVNPCLSIFAIPIATIMYLNDKRK